MLTLREVLASCWREGAGDARHPHLGVVPEAGACWRCGKVGVPLEDTEALRRLAEWCEARGVECDLAGVPDVVPDLDGDPVCTECWEGEADR